MRDKSTRKVCGYSGERSGPSSSAATIAPAPCHSGRPNRVPASDNSAAPIPASPARATKLRSSARNAGIARICGPMSSGHGASTDSRASASIWS